MTASGSRSVLKASQVQLPDSDFEAPSSHGTAAAGPFWPDPPPQVWQSSQPTRSPQPVHPPRWWPGAQPQPCPGAASVAPEGQPRPPGEWVVVDSPTHATPGRNAQAEDDADCDGGNSTGTIVVQHERQSLAPVVWSAVGRAAGTAWTVLKFCNRYVLMPAVSWGLQVLKAYLERQLAIQRSMVRPCRVPLFPEAELRAATAQLGPHHRALGSPYGMVAYLTRLRGTDVAVRPLPLSSLEDVEAFWAEEAAGRALLAAGRHPHVAPYLGACPPLACHVYEQVPKGGGGNGGVGGSSGGGGSGSRFCCSLREALLGSAGPQHRAALGGWEVRLALCGQLVAAVLHCARCGVALSNLSTANIIVRLDFINDSPATQAGGGNGASTSGSGGSSTPGGGPHCWLAPACGFRAPLVPGPGTVAPARPGLGSPIQQHAASASIGQAGQAEAKDAARGQVAFMARSLGHVLMQILAGADAPSPSASTILEALSGGSPAQLLAPGVAPPLTDAQAWPLLAAVYTLLDWGRSPAQKRPEESGGGARSSAAAAAAGGCVGGGEDDAGALQSHLSREVAPAVAELQRQVKQAAEAARRMRRAAEPVAAEAPAAGAAPHDPFADASAPPLPPHVYPVVPGAEHAPSAPPLHTDSGAPAPAEAASCHAGTAPVPPAPSVPPIASPARPAAATPPAEFVCPITHELMEDPVVAADGHSYERAAIAEWLAAAARGRGGRATSPLTGAALPHSGLTPNYTLRSLIRDWRERQGGGGGA